MTLVRRWLRENFPCESRSLTSAYPRSDVSHSRARTRRYTAAQLGLVFSYSRSCHCGRNPRGAPKSATVATIYCTSHDFYPSFPLSTRVGSEGLVRWRLEDGQFRVDVDCRCRGKLSAPIASKYGRLRRVTTLNATLHWAALTHFARGCLPRGRAGAGSLCSGEEFYRGI